MSLEMHIPVTEQEGDADPTEIRQPVLGTARQVIVRRLDDVDGGGCYVGVGRDPLHLSQEAAEALLIALVKLLIDPSPGQVRP